MKKNKDQHLMVHMLEYCKRIGEATEKIGDISNLLTSSFNQDALAMPLVQLGELVRVLSDELKDKYTMVPWAQIRATRNHLIHSYVEIDWEEIWNTAIKDIPKLEKQCTKILRDIRNVKDVSR